MPKIIFSFALSLVFLLTACQDSADSSHIISIQEQGDLLSVDPALDQHKDKDVEVYKVDDVQEVGERKYFLKGYRFVYYHDYDGTLTSLQNFLPTPANFDKAEVNWVDDTTLTLRFFNSQSQEESSLRIFGKNAAQMVPIQN